MRYYPIFVKLVDRDCLVVGAGEVGRRKIKSLLDSGARNVLVIDTRPPGEDMAEIVADPRVTYAVRGFEECDLEGRYIVIASTSNEEINWRISNLCREKNILCNIVDQPEKCSFIVPAVSSHGDLTVAVSTGGASPALAKKIRRDLDDYFGGHYGDFLVLMARLRPLVLELNQGTDANTAIFRDLVNSDMLEAMRDKDAARARRVLSQQLPAELNRYIDELTDGLI